MACRGPGTKCIDEGEISGSYQNEEFGVSETFWNFKLTHYPKSKHVAASWMESPIRPYLR